MRFGSPPHPMRPIEKSGNHRSFQDVRSLCYRAPAVITRLPLALRCKVWISGAALDDSRSQGGRRGKGRTTKSGKSRTIPIQNELRLVLERLRNRCDGGLVFRARRGDQLRPRNEKNM